MRWRRTRPVLTGWWTPSSGGKAPADTVSRVPLGVRWALVVAVLGAATPVLWRASTVWWALDGVLLLACALPQGEGRHWTRGGAIWTGWVLAWLVLVALFPADPSGALTPQAVASVVVVPVVLGVMHGRFAVGLGAGLLALATALIQLRWGDPMFRPGLWALVGLLVGGGVLGGPALQARWAAPHLGVRPPLRLRHGHGRRLFGVAVASALLCAVFQFWHGSMPAYTLDTGPEDLNHSGPTDDGGQTVVFSIQPKALQATPSDAPMRIDVLNAAEQQQAGLWLHDAYWRAHVFYTLDGATWKRPPAPTGYNLPQAVARTDFLAQPRRLIYQVTWAERTQGTASLDRPYSLLVLGGGDDGRSSLSRTRDGLEVAALRPRWGVTTYLGVAALSDRLPDPEAIEADLAWGRDWAHPTDNPRTRAVAHALGTAHGTAVGQFVPAWLTWLNAHSVYDLHRTAAGVTTDVADAFLFGPTQPGHGTCVDFATSTVLALRSVGIPARYVSGFHGATWNPYTETWVVTNGQAHAWVEYYAADEQAWVRVDPTAAIGRIVSDNPAVSAFQLWRQSLTRPFLARQRYALQARTGGPRNLLAFVSRIPLPTLQLTGTVRLVTLLAMGIGGLALGMLVWRQRRRRGPPDPDRALVRTVARIADRWERARLGAGKRDGEGVRAWLERLELPDPLQARANALAADTQAVRYGGGGAHRSVRRRWRQLDRSVRQAWRRGAAPR